MTPLSSYPYLSPKEFEDACAYLESKPHAQDQWLSVECIRLHDAVCLRVTKEFVVEDPASNLTSVASELSDCENDEEDDEALRLTLPAQALIHYDITLSPTYRVPSLYVSIKDPYHRFPPTMATLYQHIIPEAYQSQTKDYGVLGGITIADHPLEGRPVFFVHPCRTSEVMEAVKGGNTVGIEEYLMLWIGAFGKCVGLDAPMELAMSGNQ